MHALLASAVALLHACSSHATNTITAGELLCGMLDCRLFSAMLEHVQAWQWRSFFQQSAHQLMCGWSHAKHKQLSCKLLMACCVAEHVAYCTCLKHGMPASAVCRVLIHKGPVGCIAVFFDGGTLQHRCRAAVVHAMVLLCVTCCEVPF